MTYIQKKLAQEDPEAISILDEFSTLTRTQYNERCNRVAHAMRSLGFGVGSVAAIVTSNRHEFCEIANGTGSIGMLLVPINWHLAPDEIAYILKDSKTEVIFVDHEYTDKISAALESAPEPKTRICFGGEAPEGFIDYEAAIGDASPDEPEDQCTGGTMFYTSGTTGHPKGVRSTMLQIGGPVENIELLIGAFSAAMRLSPGGTAFVMAPVYHAAPYMFSMLPLAMGAKLVLRRRFDPEDTLDVIDEHSVTTMYAVPTHFNRLLSLPEERRKKLDGSSLKSVYHTAAPCPPEVKRAMIDWWGPVINELYGATEGALVAFCSSEEWLTKPGTVGKLLVTHEAIVVDDEGNRLPRGETGQLYFKSLMGHDFEYHGDPEKTAKAHLEPGVITFGDIGRVDEEGFVFLSDRKIDMIISGGVNIYPAEIEARLTMHPAVQDVAVFGIPNDDFGEETKAVVELAPTASAGDELRDELLAYCREHLAGYKVPRSIDFTDALPRTPVGKLLKRTLRDPYWEGKKRQI